MPIIFSCSNCRKPYRSCDLSTITIEPPHYEDLPEPTPQNYVNHVYDDEDEPTGEKVIRVRYCEMCLDDVELPPLRPESDPSVAPKVHHPGTEHDSP